MNDDDMSSAGEASESSNLDRELRLAFQIGRNLLAVHTAIRVAYEHPVQEGNEPYPTDTGMHYIPAWVLDVCYDLVTRELIKGKGSGVGPHAKWASRYRQELIDQRRWTVVRWCQAQGISLEAALGAASAYFGTPEKTLEKAVLRAEARRKRVDGRPVFQPVNAPGRGYMDPLADQPELSNLREDDPGWFADLMQAVIQKRERITPADGVWNLLVLANAVEEAKTAK